MKSEIEKAAEEFGQMIREVKENLTQEGGTAQITVIGNQELTIKGIFLAGARKLLELAERNQWVCMNPNQGACGEVMGASVQLEALRRLVEGDKQ